jgi:ADP-ribose pyrophosphatase
MQRVSEDDYEDLAKARPELFTNEGAAVAIVLDRESRDEVEAVQRAELAAAGLPPDWAKTGIVFRDQYMTVLRDAVRHPSGTTGTYIRRVSSSPGPVGVAVLPKLEAGYLLVRHFRHATRQWHWEIPRGFLDADESPETAAFRELREEVAVEAGELTSLGTMLIDSGMGDDAVGLFLARAEGVPQPNLDEGISDVRTVSVGELMALIADGTISDSFTLAAVARATAQRRF